ncbi:transposase [Rhodococcus sp. D-6]|uniref:Transposase n=1 Tax=Rhodococcus sp. D-6 TaxID=1387842 RepID=A0AAU7UV89_9NOCA
MTQPKLAHATEWGRMYGRFVGDRPRVPSITTVLGEAPDTLHGWHARVAADAMKAYLDGGDALARYPHVTAAIDEARARNRDVDRAARKAIAGTGLWLADQAAERGDRVHDYAEQVARYCPGVQLRYRYRLYPTPGQQNALAQALGCARVVFNDAIAARERARRDGLPYPKDAELSKALTAAKRTPERKWLGEVSSVVLQQALADANTAYRNFFASISGKRKGRKVGPPRFRSRRDHRQTIRFTRNACFAVTGSRMLRLPKIGDVKLAWSRELPSEPSSVTVVKDAAGRYFASFVVETSNEPLPELDAEVGIDLGLTTFAVLSNGTIIDSPKFFRRAERKLRKAQQDLSRKEKGSRNRAKARLRVARAHARVSDARKDWAHKHSTTIIRENQAMYVEDLCVTGLARTHLAKSVHDAGWATFIRLLEEKAARYGRVVGKVNRFFPSSQTCSTCGRIDGPKPLSVRTWTCPCGAVHDRDLNAARNILAAGRAERQNACGETVSLPHNGEHDSMKQEPTESATGVGRNPRTSDRGGRQKSKESFNGQLKRLDR